MFTAHAPSSLALSTAKLWPGDDPTKDRSTRSALLAMSRNTNDDWLSSSIWSHLRGDSSGGPLIHNLRYHSLNLNLSNVAMTLSSTMNPKAFCIVLPTRAFVVAALCINGQVFMRSMSFELSISADTGAASAELIDQTGFVTNNIEEENCAFVLSELEHAWLPQPRLKTCLALGSAMIDLTSVRLEGGGCRLSEVADPASLWSTPFSLAGFHRRRPASRGDWFPVGAIADVVAKISKPLVVKYNADVTQVAYGLEYDAFAEKGLPYPGQADALDLCKLAVRFADLDHGAALAYLERLSCSEGGSLLAPMTNPSPGNEGSGPSAQELETVILDSVQKLVDMGAHGRLFAAVPVAMNVMSGDPPVASSSRSSSAFLNRSDSFEPPAKKACK